MAYTQNPVISTQQTKRFDFTGSNEQRSYLSDKDQRYVNFYPTKTTGMNKRDATWWLQKRPGTVQQYNLGTGEIRGVYYWNVEGNPAYMSIIDNRIYYDGTFLSTIGTSTGPVGFTEYLDDTGARKLILLDGTNGYVFIAYNAAPTQITDVNFPSPHIPMPIFLDGYLFVAKKNTQDVYNSNLNDPLTWTAGDYVSAEMWPDTVVALAKNNNYIYAIGQYSIEFLYDAANDSGSPLRRHDSAIQQFGTPAPETVVVSRAATFMVGQSQMGGRSVYSIDGFKETDIGTPAIQYALNQEGLSIADATGYMLYIGGQTCYVLVLSSRMFVYGVEDKIWFEWSFTNNPRYACDSNDGFPRLLCYNGSNAVIALIGPHLYQDFGVTFSCTLITSKYDFDGMDRKRMDILSLVGDSPSTGNTDISIQWSDDDYNTWSTARTMSLNTNYSRIYRLGMFRRRAFMFTYTQNAPLRLEGMEITINKGQT